MYARYTLSTSPMIAMYYVQLGLESCEPIPAFSNLRSDPMIAPQSMQCQLNPNSTQHRTIFSSNPHKGPLPQIWVMTGRIKFFWGYWDQFAEAPKLCYMQSKPITNNQCNFIFDVAQFWLRTEDFLGSCANGNVGANRYPGTIYVYCLELSRSKFTVPDCNHSTTWFTARQGEHFSWQDIL